MPQTDRQTGNQQSIQTATTTIAVKAKAVGMCQYRPKPKPKPKTSETNETSHELIVSLTS